MNLNAYSPENKKDELSVLIKKKTDTLVERIQTKTQQT